VGKHPTTKGGNIKKKKRTEEEKSRELKDRKWERKAKEVAELQGGKEMMEMVLSVVNFCLEPVGDIAIDEEVEDERRDQMKSP
jgi:hypothetical protein